jgi:hypothetical protein
VDFSTDELRRELRDARRAHAEAEGPTRDLYLRLLDESSPATPEQRATAVLGPLARRRFLRVGGFSVLGAAVLAACGGPGEQGSVPIAGTGATTTSAPERVVNDAVILRTASSLEFNLIGVYDLAIDSGLITDAAMADAIRLFRDQHQEHAALFVSLTTEADGTPFEEPNPVVQAGVVDPALKLLADNGNNPDDALYLAYGLEQLAAETYQTFVQVFTEPRHRSAVLSVGGVEARHAAVLAGVIPNSLVIPAAAPPPSDTTAPPTTEGPDEVADRAPVFQVPGAFQPLTSVEITIGITTINVEPLGPNSYMYQPAAG